MVPMNMESLQQTRRRYKHNHCPFLYLPLTRPRSYKLPSIQTKSIHSISVYKHHVARLQDPTQAEGERYVQADVVDEAFPVQNLSETQAEVEADTEGEVVGETGRQLGSLAEEEAGEKTHPGRHLHAPFSSNMSTLQHTVSLNSCPSGQVGT